MNCKERLENYLREEAVPFEVQHHPKAVTAQEVAATEDVPGFGLRFLERGVKVRLKAIF